MTRRRVLLATSLLAGVVLVAWLAIWGLTNTRLELRGAANGDGVTFVTDFPAGVCSKTFSVDFPFVRFTCEPSPEAGP